MINIPEIIQYFSKKYYEVIGVRETSHLLFTKFINTMLLLALLDNLFKFVPSSTGIVKIQAEKAQDFDIWISSPFSFAIVKQWIIDLSMKDTLKYPHIATYF